MATEFKKQLRRLYRKQLGTIKDKYALTKEQLYFQAYQKALDANINKQQLTKLQDKFLYHYECYLEGRRDDRLANIKPVEKSSTIFK